MSMWRYFLYSILIDLIDGFGVFELLPMYDPYDDPESWDPFD